KVEGRAWARLLEERYRPEVEAVIGVTVNERRDEWRSMVKRAIKRGELPPGTDAQLHLDLVRAIVDARSSSRRLDTTWLTRAVGTVIAGARGGTLVRGRRARSVAAPSGSELRPSSPPGGPHQVFSESMAELSSQRFYHGTKANLKPGDLIEPGRNSNYGRRK